MKRKNKKTKAVASRPTANTKKALKKVKAAIKKDKQQTQRRKPAIDRLVVQQQSNIPKVVVGYDDAVSRIYPQKEIRLIVPSLSSEPTVVPRELVTESFMAFEVAESGEHAKSINFGLCYKDQTNGWVFVETMPTPKQPHAVIKDCEGKKCVACVAPATHKIIEVVESGEPKKAYLCCYHFCFAVFGRVDSNQCR